MNPNKTVSKQLRLENWLDAKAVVGFFPADSDEDDVILYADESRTEVLATLHYLRQQNVKASGRPKLLPVRLYCAGRQRRGGLYRRLRRNLT